MQKIKDILDFLKTDIWRVSLNNISGKKAFLFRKLRILLLTLRCFNEDKCTLRGSALTFYVLMSIVPIAAMGFGIAKGFSLDQKLKNELLGKEYIAKMERIEAAESDKARPLKGQPPKLNAKPDVPSPKLETTSSTPENVDTKTINTLDSPEDSFDDHQKKVIWNIIKISDRMLSDANGGAVAGVGVLILFWTVIKVLGNIELSFNDIWGVRESRTIARKFSDYLSLMAIAPLSLIISIGANGAIALFFGRMVAEYEFVAMFGGIIRFGLRFLPLIFISIFFSFIYILIPNTKVKLKPALIGGLVAGVLYQILQIIYFGVLVGVSKQAAIYGSFAALPLFLVWLQFSWYILLFGAELAFAVQNVDTFIYESDTKSISPALKRLLSLQIVHLIVREFKTGEHPETDSEIADDLDLPIRLVREILRELHEAGIISEIINAKDNSITFQPARTIESMSINQIIHMLENTGSSKIPVKQTEGVAEISKALEEFKTLLDSSPANVLIKDV